MQMSVETVFENLYGACCKGEEQTAISLLDQKDIDIVDILNTRHQDNGTTVLHMAADEGLTKVVQEVLDKGCPIHIVDYEGLNVLHWALRKGKSTHMVEALLDRDDCFPLYDQSATEEGFTPLICGLKNGSGEAAKVLLKYDGQHALWSVDRNEKQTFRIDFGSYMASKQNIYVEAMKIDDPELIKLLLEKDQHWREGVVMEQDGKNGLVIAAEQKLWKNVEVVLVDGDLSLSQSDLESVLVEVVRDGNHNLLDKILTKELKKGTLCLSTSLIHAALASPKRAPKIVEMLIKNEVDITGVNENGYNIVHVIASNGDDKILSVVKDNLPQRSLKTKFQDLLSQKCPVYKTVLCFGDIKQPYELKQCNALHIATVNMDFAVLSKLLLYKANPHDTDESGRSPLQLVKKLNKDFGNHNQDCSRKFHEIYKALLKADKEVSEKVFENLYRACYKGEEETAISLLDQKDIDIVEILNTRHHENGTTVLHMAVDQGLSKVVQKVLDKGCPIHLVDDEGLNVLHWALQKGKSKHMVQALLEREDCFPLYDQSATKEGFTPLICGLKNGSGEAAKALLKYDGQHALWSVDRNEKQTFRIDFKSYMASKQNIYVEAMNINDPELIKLLLEKDLHWREGVAMEQDGKNGLVIAAEQKLWKNVEVVLVDGDLSLSQSDLESVLVEVVRDGNHNLLDKILTKQFKKGTLCLSTSLIHAALASPKRNTKIVEMLIQNEVDITGVNENGHNIVHVIASNGDEKSLSVVRVNLPQRSSNKKFQDLLSQKCPVYKTVLCFGDIKQPYELKQCNALHIAAVNMDFAVLSKLLLYEANLHDTDESGRSPLQLVKELKENIGSRNQDCSLKFDEIYEALLKAGKEVSDTNIEKIIMGKLENVVLGSIAEMKTDVVSIKEKVETIEVTTNQSHEVMKQVTETVTLLEQNLEKTSVETKKALEDVKEELVLLKCSVSTEEMVYYELLHRIAKEVGRSPRGEDHKPLWERFADELLTVAACPTKICSTIKEKVNRDNNSDQECALQFLVIWKSLICQGKIQLPVIQAVLKKLNVEIPDLTSLETQLAEYWQRSESVDLSDRLLNDIARMIGKEWMELGLELDLDKSELEKIDVDNSRLHDKILEMLLTWRRKEAGYSDVKMVHLCKALKKIGRADIAHGISTKSSKLCNIV